MHVTTPSWIAHLWNLVNVFCIISIYMLPVYNSHSDVFYLRTGRCPLRVWPYKFIRSIHYTMYDLSQAPRFYPTTVLWCNFITGLNIDNNFPILFQLLFMDGNDDHLGYGDWTNSSLYPVWRYMFGSYVAYVWPQKQQLRWPESDSCLPHIQFTN